MSNTTAIALITANFALLFFCYHYIAKLTNDVATEVETGVIQGIPISLKYRRIRLYQVWSGYALGAVTCAIFLTVVSMHVAGSVDDAGVKAVAHVAAAVGVVGALGFASNGLLEFFHYRSTLRQAEAD